MCGAQWLGHPPIRFAEREPAPPPALAGTGTVTGHGATGRGFDDGSPPV
jgi:hypothetical protein